MELDKSIVPIYIETKIPKRIKQIGTAVFIDFHSEPFLFTAAHVTDDLEHGKLLVPTVNGLSEIEGYLAHIDLLPEMSRNQDTVDMAYYRLSSRFASDLCYQFSPLSQTSLELIPTALELSVVSVVGYPASKSKKKGYNLSSELIYYRGVSANKNIYEQHKLCPTTSTIIQFNKKNVRKPDGQMYTPPSPSGVSGGAIFAWPLGHELSQDWAIPKLVAIFHSYKEKDGLLIGTNLINFVAATQLGRMKNYNGVV